MWQSAILIPRLPSTTLRTRLTKCVLLWKFFMYSVSTRPHTVPRYPTSACTVNINLIFDPQEPYVSERPVAMEYLSVNNQWGQGYGYALYRTLIPADSTKITVQGVKDYGLVGHVMLQYIMCGVTWCLVMFMVSHGASPGHGGLQTSKETVLLWERDISAAKDHQTGMYVSFWFHVQSEMCVSTSLGNSVG